jgi:hypothetical protein
MTERVYVGGTIALEPPFELKFPRDKPKKITPHETCDRLMSQFTSQLEDLRKRFARIRFWLLGLDSH